MGWNLILRFKCLEVWKTPTKYLACYPYGRVFFFTDTQEEAIQIIKEYAETME